MMPALGPESTEVWAEMGRFDLACVTKADDDLTAVFTFDTRLFWSPLIRVWEEAREF